MVGIQPLKRSHAPGPVVDPMPNATHGKLTSVDASRPFDSSFCGVFFRPLGFQQRLRFSISHLLFQICADRRAAVMPYHGARVKTDLPPPLQQTPANIDIVSGRSELHIKASDSSEFPCSKRAITTGNVLSIAMGNHHMSGAARRICDAFGNRAVLGRNIGPSYGRVIGVHVGPGQVLKPVRIRPGIVVKIGDDLPTCRVHSGISCGTEALIALANQAYRILPGNIRTVVSGSIIHDDDLVIRILQHLQTFKTVPQRARTIVSTDNDRYCRPLQVSREGNCLEGVSYSREGWLGLATSRGEAEVPVLDVMLSAVPFVHPGEHKYARASGGKNRADLP